MTCPSGPVERIVRWRCDECGWTGADDALLRAPSPFGPMAILAACPDCKEVGMFTNLCDEPECSGEATCGGPGHGGEYRRTCHKHAEWLNKPPNAGAKAPPAETPD